VTVKQVFETYVYAQILSSVDLLPFVISLKNGGHGKFHRNEEFAMRVGKD
jgi:hypothetical protein